MKTGRRKLWKLMLKDAYREKKAVNVLLLLLLMGEIFLFAGCGKEEREGYLSIGMPDGAGSIIVEYLAKEKVDFLKSEMEFALYPIKDCCSSTSTWALSSREVDMAIICPDAAEELVKKDARYVVYGPVLANSDVFLIRKNVEIKSIGYTQNRWYQKKLIEQKFKGARPVPMLSASLPYALEKKAVDGIIVDISNCFEFSGDLVPVYTKGQDVVTYVLVVNREVVNRPSFKRLMQAWKEAAAELNDNRTLKNFWSQQNGEKYTAEEMKVWKRAGIKFLIPTSEKGG